MKVCEDGESESGDVEVSAASTSSPFAPQVICSVQLCRTATMGRGLAGWPGYVCAFGKQVTHRCPGPIITAYLV